MRTNYILLTLGLLFLIILFGYITGFSILNHESSVFIPPQEPVVNLILPSDNYVSNVEEINFKFVAKSYFRNMTECFFIVDGSVSDSWNFSERDIEYSFSLSFSPKSYFWSVYCVDEIGLEGFSDNRTFTIVLDEPVSEIPERVVSPAGGMIEMPIGRSHWDFIAVDKNKFTHSMIKGEIFSDSFKIFNFGDSSSVSISNSFEGLILSDYDFRLRTDEEKEIDLFFNSSDWDVGIYNDVIVVSSRGYVRFIPVTIFVSSEKVDFGFSMFLRDNFIKGFNQNLVFDLEFIDSVKLDGSELKLRYGLIDSEGIEFDLSSEVIFMERKSIFREVEIPFEIEDGDYLFFVRAEFLDEVAFDFDYIEVKRFYYLRLFIFVLFAVLLILIVLLLSFYRRFKKRKSVR